MAFNIKSYWNPTPKRIRKIGILIASFGALIGSGTGIYSYFEVAAQTEPKLKSILMIISIAGPVLGWIGKEITNFYDDEPSQ